MNSKNILSIILILILHNNLLKGQNLKLYYNLEFIKDTLKKSIESRRMVLLIERQNYIFCTEDLLIKDSLKNNHHEYSPVIMDEEINFMIKKKDQLFSKYYLVDENLYTINENTLKLNWQIKDQIKIIGDIKCQLATLTYKGRKWEAWFSPKYSIPYGPYIFHGLPGVIVELRDTKGNYIFKLLQIKDTKEDINRLIDQPIWIDEKSLKIKKEQLEKLYLTEYADPFRRMKEKKIIFMVDEKTGEHQPPPDFDKMTKNAQKSIRDNNNPIELSEAVKYPIK